MHWYTVAVAYEVLCVAVCIHSWFPLPGLRVYPLLVPLTGTITTPLTGTPCVAYTDLYRFIHQILWVLIDSSRICQRLLMAHHFLLYKQKWQCHQRGDANAGSAVVTALLRSYRVRSVSMGSSAFPVSACPWSVCSAVRCAGHCLSSYSTSLCWNSKTTPSTTTPRAGWDNSRLLWKPHELKIVSQE